MDISILIPHYKTGKMCAYTISQILKYKGSHNVSIIVIDNNYGDGSIEYIDTYARKVTNNITIFNYPKDKLQSHGIAFSHVLNLGYVKTPHFITLESDCFPVRENWLNFYQLFIDNNYDMAGSLLNLSGGRYIHPSGAIYKTEFVKEAQMYCQNMPYHYLSNFGVNDGFDCHVMVHNDIWGYFLENPNAFIELPESKNNYTKDDILRNENYYRPVVSAFHNGMGFNDERVSQIGNRNPITDPAKILYPSSKRTIVHRVGYEPGQWLTYYALATGKKVAEIATETIWMPGRENQQQEYTLTENGVKHLWGVSSFAFSDKADIQDIAVRKKNLPEELYETLPEEYKIKMPMQ